MTLDKAIEVLEKQLNVYGKEYDEEGIEALTIAIYVLKQQPCVDCISREAVKRILANQRDELIKLHTVNPEDNPKADAISYGVNWSLNTLMDLPSVTPKARWIPVSERLPEKQGCYLVTTKWKGGYSGDVYIETNMAVYREKPKEWDCVDVIAWMPLPQPYKAESEGDEE